MYFQSRRTIPCEDGESHTLSRQLLDPRRPHDPVARRADRVPSRVADDERHDIQQSTGWRVQGLRRPPTGAQRRDGRGDDDGATPANHMGVVARPIPMHKRGVPAEVTRPVYGFPARPGSFAGEARSLRAVAE